MKNILTIVAFGAFLLASLSHASEDALLKKLMAIPGLTVSERAPEQGYRIFDMRFSQAADHSLLGGETFEQRLVLWHKREDRPMVLQTSGYKIFSIALSGLASEFDANQIQVEHRFFAHSTPASKDWRLLNIAQSAADFHAITEAFKTIYKAKWVNTGRSKGGMTSVYHRRFYPHDLDATVAHVAPQSYSTKDARFADFLSNDIGGLNHKGCREQLINVQRVLLKNREVVLNTLEGNFSFLHSKDIAMEHAIIELPWTFWQYHTPDENCSNVPDADAPLDDHIAFLYSINNPESYTDSEVESFSPYFYQAASELGNPLTPIDAIADLLLFADTFNVLSYTPKESNAVYDDASAMLDVKQWLAQQSSQMLFIYGEWDPWSAGAYEPNTDPSSDSYLFYVPQANHGAQFLDLKGEARDLAYGRLRKWLNIEDEHVIIKTYSGKRAKTLEDLEFEAARNRHQI